MTEPRGGFPVGLTVAVAIAFAILVGLGTWQVQRLHWKEGLLARVAALQAAPARPIGAVLDEVSKGGDADFTRAKAVCPGIAAAPFVELYAIRDGEVGSRLVSACRTDSLRYRSVLVDRGFVADTISARPAVDAASTTPVEVIGVLRKPDRANLFSPANTPARWYTRDIAAMATALKAPDAAPLTLMAETATNPDWKALVPAPVPAEIPNRHLEYAITWYGLAAVLLGVYAAMLWKRRKT
ncbi:MAG TPA: SURF1 family cytochrome oxidase biogenesis protein [Caulobacteraceae bacterium]|jgi:surfeit locus 1 family protein|nr:SURF1 family cytochrome oxidase biogenesis protein [Caulobacteraceae bacterium]